MIDRSPDSIDSMGPQVVLMVLVPLPVPRLLGRSLALELLLVLSTLLELLVLILVLRSVLELLLLSPVPELLLVLLPVPQLLVLVLLLVLEQLFLSLVLELMRISSASNYGSYHDSPPPNH